jgi:hypothetical protein
MPTVHDSLQQQQRRSHADADSLDASFTALDAVRFTEYLERTAAALQTHSASIRATAIAAIATHTQTVSATYVQTLASVIMLALLLTLKCLRILLLTACTAKAYTLCTYVHGPLTPALSMLCSYRRTLKGCQWLH